MERHHRKAAVAVAVAAVVAAAIEAVEAAEVGVQRATEVVREELLAGTAGQ